MIDRPPLVSVIMSAYNSKSTIGESIESILSQSYQNIELLICNDGSTDDTQIILNSFQKKDSRVRLFQNPKNLGLTASLNTLIAESKGVFIARQDADDISLPERLEEQLKYCLVNNYEVVTSRSINKLNNKTLPRFSYFLPYKVLIKFRNPFIHGTLVIKKELLNKVGNYDENFTYAQDYKLYRDLVDRRIKIKKIWKKLYILNTVNNISNIFKSEQSYFANCVRNRKKP